MSRLPAPETRSGAQRALDSLKRWRRRRLAIQELRTMARWRLADLGVSADQIPAFVDALLDKGVSADQIPAFVDALLDKQEHGTARIAPTEVQATRTQWMLGPWADGLAGP